MDDVMLTEERDRDANRWLLFEQVRTIGVSARQRNKKGWALKSCVLVENKNCATISSHNNFAVLSNKCEVTYRQLQLVLYFLRRHHQSDRVR